jgi:hypothetical protein
MTNQKPINYIPAREYLPGPDMKYQSVFLSDLGEHGEMIYLRLDHAEDLSSGKVPHFLRLYRQTKVIKRSNGEPGIVGVHAEEVTGLDGLLSKVSEDLQMRSVGGRV